MLAGRTYEFDISNGGGALTLTAPSFSMPVSSTGTVSFTTPFAIAGESRLSFPGTDGLIAHLTGQGSVTGTFAAFFDPAAGGTRFDLLDSGLRFEFVPDAAPVPEPSSILLLMSGAALLARRSRAR